MTKKEVRKLDKLFREHMRKKTGGKCELCGKDNAQIHHVVGRRNRRLRWDELNAVMLCPKHHTFDSKLSAHQGVAGFQVWLEETRGKDYMKKLYRLSNEIFKGTYEQVLQRLL